MYKINKFTIAGNESQVIIRVADNASIPNDPQNTDYAAYLKWLEEGNTPKPAFTVSELLVITKAKQKTLIETAYQTAITAPIAYMATTFQADNASQDILVKVLVGMQVAGATPSGFAWLDANNVLVPMTLADLQGLYGAILTRGQVEFTKKVVAKNAINVATTIAEVEAVVL